MNNFDTLIENGLVVTENEIGQLNIGIRDGKVAYLGDKNLNAELKINANNLIILPGGIDPHVHVDQPSGDDVIWLTIFNLLQSQLPLEEIPPFFHLPCK